MKRSMGIALIVTALGGCGSRSAEVAEAPGPAPAPMSPPTSPAETQPSAPSARAAAPVPDAPVPIGENFREVFPYVWLDAATKVVRFDGTVPIDAHDEKSPWVFLEVVVCTPDTKEHEAIVVTEAKASHVHAALLLAGLEPGSPGKWVFEEGKLRSIPPSGDALRVTLSYQKPDGTPVSLAPEEMIVNAHNGRRFGAGNGGKWVFAGSQILKRGGNDVYDADGAGTLIGLTTFGSETVAWSEVISPEAAVEEPAWIADRTVTPRAGTPITVTIQRAE